MNVLYLKNLKILLNKYFQKLTGGGMDAPLKKGGIVGYKKGGVVRGLDEGIHKNVRLI